MRNAIAVFITCNAIHATAISLRLSLLSSAAVRARLKAAGICKPNLPQRALGWTGFKPEAFFARNFRLSRDMVHVSNFRAKRERTKKTKRKITAKP